MERSKLSKLADELEGLDDEPTGEVHVHMPKGTTLEADATGKLRAISIHDDDITPHDPPRKQSDPPPKSGIPGLLHAGGGVIVRVVGAVNNPYALLALALLVAAFVAWLRLRP
jgi:hypothetical protein